MKRVQEIIETHGITSVVHFTGSLVVPESVEMRLAYYLNNTAPSRNLIDVCVNCSVLHFIFSSTCAVYGIADELPIKEKTAIQPISPSGRSKLMTEQILQDTAAAHGLSFVSFR